MNNMKINPWISLFVVVLVLVSSFAVSADTPVPDAFQNIDWSTANWNDITTQPNFNWNYVKWDQISDWTAVTATPSFDWKYVNWKKIDYSNPTLYKAKGFDNNKVNIDKYLKDLKCTGCSFQKNNFDVKFSEKGITHPNGDSVSIPGTYPAKTLFIADKDGLRVVLPSGSESNVNIPATDTVTLDTNNKVITLADGTTVNGKLSFKDGQAYIKAGDKTTVNGVLLEPEGGNVLVCFTSCKKTTLSDDMKVIMTKNTFEFDKTKIGAKITCIFAQDNPYLKIEKGDYVTFFPDLYFQGSYKITNRDDKGLIPLVQVDQKSKDSDLRITNGKVIINIIDKISTTLDTDRNYKGSSPMVIDALGKTMIISNYNEIATIDFKKVDTAKISQVDTQSKPPVTIKGTALIPLYDDKNQLLGYTLQGGDQNIIVDENGNHIGKRNGDTIKYDATALEGWTALTENGKTDLGKVSERLYFNYQSSSTFYLDNIPVTGLDSPEARKKISDLLSILPPEVKASLKGFILYSDDDYNKMYIQRHIKEASQADLSDAMFTQGDDELRLRESSLTPRILYHESMHAFAEKQREDERSFGYASFENTWYQVQTENKGEDYGTATELVKTDHFNGIIWKDKESDFDHAQDPGHGCVLPYGCTLLEEDYATYGEVIMTKPDTLRNLVQKSGDVRYAKKVTLLYIYGAISQDRYNYVMNGYWDKNKILNQLKSTKK